jgi:hypothetical protein
VSIEDAREIEERAGDGRDRDAVEVADLVGREG